jgi:hypothetical protein
MISMLRARIRNEVSDAVGQLDEFLKCDCFTSIHICQCSSLHAAIFSAILIRILQILPCAGVPPGADHHSLQPQHVLLQLTDAEPVRWCMIHQSISYPLPLLADKSTTGSSMGFFTWFP